MTCFNLMVKLAGLKAPNCLIAPAATSCFFATIQGGRNWTFATERFWLTKWNHTFRWMPKRWWPILSSRATPRKRIGGSAERSQSNLKVPQVRRGKRVSAVAIELPRWRELAEALRNLGHSRSQHRHHPAALATRACFRDLDLSERSGIVARRRWTVRCVEG